MVNLTFKDALVHIQGDPKLAPPSRAEMKNAPAKLSIAFSNTTYLNIIWSFLGFQHLPQSPIFRGFQKRSILPQILTKYGPKSA